MLKFHEGDVRKLFNTSGIQYRELELAKKLHEMPLEKALDLLSKNGMLVKRPFALHADGGLLGFKEASWKKALA